MSLSGFLKAVYLRHWGLLLTLVVLFFLLVWLWPVLSPFFAAALICYLVSSPARWLVSRTGGQIPYSVSAVFFVLGFIVVCSGIFLLLVPVVLGQIDLIQQNLPTILATSAEKVLPWLNAHLGFEFSLEPAELRQKAQEFLLGNSDSLAKTAGHLFSLGSDSVLGLTGFITLVATAALFMAPGWESLCRTLGSLVPPKMRSRWAPVKVELNQTLSHYLKGVGIVVTFQGAFYAIGLTLAGLTAGWAIGLLAGVLSLIPYIGLTLSLILAVLTAVLELQGFGGILVVVAIFAAGQVIEGFVLTPWVVGDRIGLSAIAVVFSLAFFGALFGPVGVVFALPLAACLRVLIVRQVQWYKQSDFYEQLGQVAAAAKPKASS